MEPELLEKIAAARRLAGQPPGRRLTGHGSLADLLFEQASRRPDQDYLVFHDAGGSRRAWSYREFDDAVRRTATWLRRRGLGPGDRLATVSANHADTVIQYHAAWLLGAVVVPINVGEDDERVAYILADSQAKLAFVRDDQFARLEALQAGLPGLRALVATGAPQPQHDHFDAILADTGPAPPGDFAPDLDAEALIVYTSGTTGHPKGVVLTQYNLLVDGEHIAAWHGIGSGDRMMCVLPIHHVNGTVVTLVTPLAAGGTAVLNHRFRTDTFFARLAEEEINVVSVVPTLLAFLLQAAESGRIEMPGLPHFRHIICGAGPLTVELALQFQDRFGLRIVHGYGLSETTCYSCFLPVDLDEAGQRSWLGDHGFPSIGLALPANEMDIHDPDGRSVPAGERGEIVIRGHNVMAGYFRNDTANAEAFAHGWFRSGDEGFYRTDDTGRRFYFITGRLKELIIRGGVNVSPLEIDEILMNIPGVKAGVSVGFPNDVYGEEIGAYVVLRDGVAEDAEAVLAACAAQLPHHKRPKVVVFGSEVPVTSTGKYQRNRLKTMFAEWRAVQFAKER